MKNNNNTIYVVIGVIGLILFWIGFSIDDKPQNTTNVSDTQTAEPKGTLSDCLGEASEWYEQSKKTGIEVIENEAQQGVYDSYDKQTEIDYVLNSLAEEYEDYKKECQAKF